MEVIVLSRKARRVLAYRAVKQLAVTTNLVQEKPYTCVEMSLEVGKRIIRAVGFSKAMWPDEWDSWLGEEIARNRALKAVYERVVGHRKFREIFDAMLVGLGWDLEIVLPNMPLVIPVDSGDARAVFPSESPLAAVTSNELA